MIFNQTFHGYVTDISGALYLKRQTQTQVSGSINTTLHRIRQFGVSLYEQINTASLPGTNIYIVCNGIEVRPDPPTTIDSIPIYHLQIGVWQTSSVPTGDIPPPI